jgi:glutamate/tyrosine decarboxylase-like PLP-dependent enzyme
MTGSISREGNQVTLPKHGISKEEALSALESFREKDVPWREGKAFGYVFDAKHEALDAGKKAYLAFLSENGLDPTSFPSLLRLENEVVRMCANHVHGDANVVGNFTSGGTESIICAMKAARDWARKHRPEITQPAMILPITAHAAFHKAAAYLGITAVTFPVDETTLKADVHAARKLIESTPNAIALVGSAPSYAYGVIDPITALGELAKEHGLWFHVDACMGGILLPAMEKNGEVVEPFDFRTGNVWSLSMDLHKYGFCPKGASVVLYRDKALRKFQIYACSEWAGYTIVNATVQSSKSGGPLAGAWATMMCMGEDGYLRITQEMRDATQRYADGINAIPGLRVVVKPDMTLVAFTSDAFPIFLIPDLMKKRGWYVQAQLGFGAYRENVHLSVTHANVPHVDAFLRDLREACEEARASKKETGLEDIAQMAQHIDPTALDDEAFARLLALAGMGDGAGVPESSAGINQILQALPRPLMKAIVVHYMNDLFH